MKRFFLLLLSYLSLPGLAQAQSNAAVTLEDLRNEAAKAPPRLAALLRLAALPADEAVMQDGQKVLVKPLAAWFAVTKEGGDAEPLESLQDKKPLPRQSIKEINYFEDRVLKQLPSWLAEDVADLPWLQRLDVAEKILRVVLAFHDVARAGPGSGPHPWDPLRRRLLARLEEIRSQMMDAWIMTAEDEAAWQQANRRAEAWLPLYPVGSPLPGKILTLLVRRAEARWQAGDALGTHALLQRIDAAFGFPEQVGGLRKNLREQAVAWQTAAEKLKASDPKNAAEKLRQALTLWPGLPGGVEEWLNLEPKVLPWRVAQRSLPQRFSPALASTDADRRCLDLLYEPLVECRLGQAGFRYHPRLAAGLPLMDGDRLVATLRPGRFWSSGDPLVANDVRHTLGLPGYSSAHSGSLGTPRLAGSPFQVEFPLHQGLWDPLTALHFPVLPSQVRGKPLLQADDPTLSKLPISSGLYSYQGQVKDGDQIWAAFLPNLYHPAWTHRARKDCKPLWLRSWQNPAKDLAATPPHLVLDAHDHQLPELGKLGFAETRTMWEPRVWLMAVNHRQPALADPVLRRALAFALDREQILDRHFRRAGPDKKPAEGSKHHRAVAGPFPPDSWAACPPPRVPASLHQVELARSLAKKAAKLGPLKLRLAFSTEDARHAGACKEMAQQCRDVLQSAGLDCQIDLTPLGSAAFHQALRQRDFDLALTFLDYNDPTFSLGHLFDDRPEALAPGGGNYLGYADDAKLQSLVRAIQSHRQFSKIRDLQHDLHAHLLERMPLIPLWQLQTHLATQPSLQLGDVDPSSPFSNVLEWTTK
jgi:ABC-type transport system substrate-binding protein